MFVGVPERQRPQERSRGWSSAGEENRFVINRKEQMALVVMPVFRFDVNIPPRAPALQ